MMKWVFGADTAPFSKGLDKMRGETKGFSNSIKSHLAAAFGVGTMVAGFKKLIDELDHVNDLANRFGESAETMQHVGFAAKMAGSDIESISKAMTVVTKNAYAAATGNTAMAESFSALGIDAASFVNMPMEDKILSLATAMQNGKGSGEVLANSMKLLGKSGGEMVPLLTQALADLEDQMKNTDVASNSTVAAMANFNDTLDTLGQKSKVVGAFVFDGFRLMFGTIGEMFNGSLRQSLIFFDTLTSTFSEFGNMAKQTLSGDFAGASDSAKRISDGYKKAFDETKQNVVTTAESIEKVFDDLDVTRGKKSKPLNVDDLQAAAEEAAKTEEDRKKLAEEIATMQEEARMKDLSLAEQILELEKERALLIDEMNNATGNDKLENEKEILEIEKKRGDLIDKRNKEEADAARKESDKIAAEMERIAEAKKQDEDSKRNRAFQEADPAGKIDILKSEQAKLLKDAQEAVGAGDQATAIEKRTAAREKGYEIQDILKEAVDAIGGSSAPTIGTSSLATIGAGGSANLLTGDTLQRQQVDLLRAIVENTSKSATGNTNIPEPV